MNNIFTALKKVVMTALIGLSLWSVAVPAIAASVDYNKNERGNIQNTERYDQIQEKTGGMNNFEAVDPRRNTKAAEAKAQTLIDTAKRRNAQAETPLEPAKEAIESLKNKVSGTAAVLTDDLGETVQELASDVHDTSKDLASGLDKTSDDFAENFAKRADKFATPTK